MWQVLLAVAGLLIVAVVLVVPHGRGTTLVANPAAVVGSSADQNGQASQPVVQQQSSQDAATPDPSPAATSDPASQGTTSAGTSGSASGDASGSASTSAGTSTAGVTGPVRLPAVPAVSSVGRTLFSDNFMGDPLGLGLPTGWLLGDPQSSGSGLLGGLPILGSLLGGGGQSGSSLLPTTILDGASHVLSRDSGSWSHLSAGPTTVNGTMSADVKMVGSASGFAGVAGRFVNASNFMACGVGTGGSLELLQVVGGRQQLLASMPAAITSGVFHTVRMTLNGGSASCSVDGGMSVQASGVMTGGGKIGLVGLGEMTSEFNNVLATALP